MFIEFLICDLKDTSVAGILLLSLSALPLIWVSQSEDHQNPVAVSALGFESVSVLLNILYEYMYF